MKIIHVIRSLHRAGAEKLCVDICNALHQHENIDVLLVSMSSVNHFEEVTRNLPFRVINSKVLPSITGKSIVEMDEFIEVVEEFKPDIIHSHLFWAELMSRHVIFPGVKYVTHCHDNMVELETGSLCSMFSKVRISRLFERQIILSKYRQCKNNFIVVSEWSKTYYQRVLPSTMQRIYLLNNAIVYDQFASQAKSGNETDVIQLINVGRLTELKNQFFLLNVAKELEKMKVKFQLHFYGDGQKMEELKRIAKEISNQIVFHGNVENIEAQYWNSDIYVHASKTESYGLVLLEAMAAGLPVITLDGKGNRDVIQQGVNGFMLYKEDPKEFADTILKVWQEKELYRQLSENATRFAQQNDMKIYIDKLISYYHYLLTDDSE
jgi:glycosyltransferase involved in cell wall biosynthesis